MSAYKEILGQLSVDIIGNKDNLSKVLEQARKEVAAFGGFFKGIGGSLGGLMGGAAGGLMGSILGNMDIGATIGKITMAASNLQETMNKVEQVFGSASSSVIQFADDLAKGFSVSKNEFLNAASTFGNMMKATGFSGEDSADMGSKLAARAIDIGSVFNMPTETAMAKLQSGLAGQMRAVRELGVDLSDTSVKAHAFAMGIGDGDRELTQAEKTLARYDSLLRQTEWTMGDAARTGEMLAGQFKQLRANTENLAAGIGGWFIPAIEAALWPINHLIQGLQETNEAFITAYGLYKKWVAGMFGHKEDPDAWAAKVEEDQRLGDVDERNKKAQQGILEEQARAAAAKDKTKTKRKSLEDFAKDLQVAGFKKDDVGKQQLDVQKQILEQQKKMNNALKKPKAGDGLNPGVPF